MTSANAGGGAAERPVLDARDYLVREVAATRHQVTIVRHALAAWLQARDVSTRLIEDIVLAATEAMSNVVDHAYPDDSHGTLALTASTEHGFLTVTITDTGHWKDIPSEAHRGRGITLIRAVAPEAAITSTPTGTTVRLTWPWASEPDITP